MNARWAAQRAVLGICMFVGLASPAFAGGPVITRSFHDEGEAIIASCGTFAVWDQYVIDSSAIDFGDHFIEQNDGSDTLSNHLGKTLPTAVFHNTVRVDLLDHVAATTGIVFRIVVPGVGPVLLDVGRMVTQGREIILFEAGPHQFFDGDLAALCAALQ